MDVDKTCRPQPFLVRIFHHVRAIGRGALQRESINLWFRAARKPGCGSGRLRKRQAPSQAPNTTVRLFGSVPRACGLPSRSTQFHGFSSIGEKTRLALRRFLIFTSLDQIFYGKRRGSIPRLFEFCGSAYLRLGVMPANVALIKSRFILEMKS